MTRHTRHRRRMPPPRRETGTLRLQRQIVDLHGFWNTCARAPCRRARACRAADVVCFAAREDEARDYTWDWMVDACREVGIDGTDLLEMADQVDGDGEDEPAPEPTGDGRTAARSGGDLPPWAASPRR